MRKVFLVLLSTIMLLSNVSICYSEESEVSESDNETNVALYALSFIDAIYGEEECEYESGDVLAFYNEYDELSGYCVDILLDGEDYGYVIVKISDGEPTVEEFSIDEGVKNPFELIVQKMDVSCEDVDDDSLNLYSIGVNEYQIQSKNDDLVYEYGGIILGIETFEDEKEAERDKQDAENNLCNDQQLTVYSSTLDGRSVITDTYSGSLSESYTITGSAGLSYFCKTNVTNAGKQYACSVVALCNLMKYYRSQGYSKIKYPFSTLYDDLWSYAETSSDGGTKVAKIAPAAKKYLKSVGYSCSYSSFTTYAKFKANLKKDKPCIMCYGALFDNEHNGHTIFVVGYVTTSSNKYLRIADGWNNTLRYINFSGYDYDYIHGYSFTVS